MDGAWHESVFDMVGQGVSVNLINQIGFQVLLRTQPEGGTIPAPHPTTLLVDDIWTEAAPPPEPQPEPTPEPATDAATGGDAASGN
jgi:hypothetical protein